MSNLSDHPNRPPDPIVNPTRKNLQDTPATEPARLAPASDEHAAANSITGPRLTRYRLPSDAATMLA